jgi:hypothetical protein
MNLYAELVAADSSPLPLAPLTWMEAYDRSRRSAPTIAAWALKGILPGSDESGYSELEEYVALDRRTDRR